LNVVFGSEALVCLQSQSVPIHPWTLVADLPWDEVEEGAQVTASRGELSVGPFVLPLAEAEVVDLTFLPPEHLVSLKELRERLALVEQVLAEMPDPFESDFDRAFVSDRDRILGEWQKTGDPAVLLDLVGRGPGTTPAGDDTLIGLLAGLEVLSAVSPARGLRILHAARNMPQAALPEPRTPASELPSLPPPATCYKPRAPAPTSALSAQLLASAAAGRFSSPLLVLQHALLDVEVSTARLVRAASDALATGQTTGKAALAGLIAAHPPWTPVGERSYPSQALRNPCPTFSLGRRRELPTLLSRSIRNE
jgi:hypothetical protein